MRGECTFELSDEQKILPKYHSHTLLDIQSERIAIKIYSLYLRLLHA